MSKHTAGPWVADVSVNDRGGWESPTQMVVIGNGETLVAMYESSYADYPDDETNEANARLIAAAPELLEALTNVLDGLCALTKRHELLSFMDEEEAEQVWAALAKATGEPQ